MDKDLWTKIQDEIKLRVEAEPSLGSFLYSLVLSQKDLIGAVASILASKLHSDALSAMDIKKFILEVYRDCKDIEIGGAVMIDHATGVVIGETCEIESEVSIFQGVTLGGKGFESGKRHPNIKKGASIFAASTILGDITIGEGAIVAAGSLVLKDVPENTTVAGVPAKIIS